MFEPLEYGPYLGFQCCIGISYSRAAYRRYHGTAGWHTAVPCNGTQPYRGTEFYSMAYRCTGQDTAGWLTVGGRTAGWRVPYAALQ